MTIGPIEHQTMVKKGLEQTKPEERGMQTLAYVEADPKIRANMRASTRWDYFLEYLGYWIDNKRMTILAVIFAAIGIIALHVFVPLGLLMIAMAAKYRNQAWWLQFVYGKFGKYRSLVLVD